MCDSIANGPVIYPSSGSSGGGTCISNVIIASNVLSTTGDVICNNLNSINGIFSGNIIVNSGYFTELFANFANIGVLNVSSLFGSGNNLTNVQSTNGFTQPLANLVVSNTVTANNLFANFANIKDVYISNSITVDGAFSSNSLNTTFFYDTLTIPYINTLFSNTVNFNSYISNIATLNVSTLENVTNLSAGIANVATLNVSSGFYAVNSNIATLNVSTLENVTNLSAGIANVATLNVSSGFYAVNSNIATLNVSTLENVTNLSAGIANVTGSTGKPSLVVTGNIYASNALSTINIFANVIQLGSGIIGSNILAISNIAGNAAIYVNSNSFVGIGTTNPTSQLTVNGNTFISADTLITPFATFGTVTTLTGVTIGAPSPTIGSNLFVCSNASSGSNVLVLNSNVQLGIGTLNPSSTLHVVGNVYVSNTISVGPPSIFMGSNIFLVSNISGNNNVFVINSFSNVGIGLPNPQFQLDLSSDGARKATTTTWVTGSDERVKTNIENANLQACYNLTKSICLKYFKWNYPDVQVNDKHMLGFIAQDVINYFPKSVFVSDSHGIPDFLSLDTDQIIKSMYGALQKTIADKESLEQQMCTLPFLVGYSSSNGPYSLQVNGQIFSTSSTIATSDSKFKTNIEDLEDSLQIVKSLNPKSFEWIEHEVHKFPLGPQIGFLAQDVRDALTGSRHLDAFVKKNSLGGEDFLGLAEGHLIPVLVGAVKELDEKLEMAQNDIDLLETRIESLENLVRSLIPAKDVPNSTSRSNALSQIIETEEASELD